MATGGNWLEFLADVIRSGSVLGADWTCSPDEIAGILGADFAENLHRDGMWRDYGVVEFFWDRHADGSWIGSHFTVQLHRLARGGQHLGNKTIEERHGPTPSRIPWQQLKSTLDAHHVPLLEIGPDDDVIRWWQPESGTIIYVAGDNPSPHSNVSIVDSGDVYAISAPHIDITPSIDHVSRQSGSDQIRHLLKLSDAERRTWTQRRSSLSGSVNWWLHLFAQTDARIRAHSATRRSWVQLRLWLLDHAQERGVFNDREIAERRAMFVAGLHAADFGDGLESVLPAADHLAQACLDAMPVALAQVHDLGDWRQLSRAEMLQLRHAKNLTNAAQWLLPRVVDPALADRIRDWIASKPRMV